MPPGNGVGPSAETVQKARDKIAEKEKREENFTCQIIFSPISYAKFCSEQGVHLVPNSKPAKVKAPILYSAKTWPNETYAYETPCDEVIFIDGGSDGVKDYVQDSPSDEKLIKYMSYGIMQLKDILYRKAKDGIFGEVQCQILSMHPMQNCMFAMSVLLGKMLSYADLYPKFVTKVVSQDEYRYTFDWIRSYSWTITVTYNASFNPHASTAETKKGNAQKAREMRNVLGNQEGMVNNDGIFRNDQIWVNEATKTQIYDPLQNKVVEVPNRRVDPETGKRYVVYDGEEWEYEKLTKEYNKIVHPSKKQLEKNRDEAKKNWETAQKIKNNTNGRIRNAINRRNSEVTDEIINHEIDNLKQRDEFKDKSDEDLKILLARKGLVPFSTYEKQTIVDYKQKDTKPNYPTWPTNSNNNDDTTSGNQSLDFKPIKKGTGVFALKDKLYFVDGRYVNSKELYKIKESARKEEKEAKDQYDLAEKAIKIYDLENALFYINALQGLLMVPCMMFPPLSLLDLGLSVASWWYEDDLNDLTNKSFTKGDIAWKAAGIAADVVSILPYFGKLVRFFKYGRSLKGISPKGTPGSVHKITNSDGSVTHFKYNEKGNLEITGKEYFDKQGRLVSKVDYKDGQISEIVPYRPLNETKTYKATDGTVVNVRIEDGKIAGARHFKDNKPFRDDFYKDGKLDKVSYNDGKEVIAYNGNEVPANNPFEQIDPKTRSYLNGEGGRTTLAINEKGNVEVVEKTTSHSSQGHSVYTIETKYGKRVYETRPDSKSYGYYDKNDNLKYYTTEDQYGKRVYEAGPEGSSYHNYDQNGNLVSYHNYDQNRNLVHSEHTTVSTNYKGDKVSTTKNSDGEVIRTEIQNENGRTVYNNDGNGEYIQRFDKEGNLVYESGETSISRNYKGDEVTTFKNSDGDVIRTEIQGKDGKTVYTKDGDVETIQRYDKDGNKIYETSGQAEASSSSLKSESGTPPSSEMKFEAEKVEKTGDNMVDLANDVTNVAKEEGTSSVANQFSQRELMYQEYKSSFTDWLNDGHMMFERNNKKWEYHGPLDFRGFSKKSMYEKVMTIAGSGAFIVASINGFIAIKNYINWKDEHEHLTKEELNELNTGISGEKQEYNAEDLDAEGILKQTSKELKNSDAMSQEELDKLINVNEGAKDVVAAQKKAKEDWLTTEEEYRRAEDDYARSRDARINAKNDLNERIGSLAKLGTDTSEIGKSPEVQSMCHDIDLLKADEEAKLEEFNMMAASRYETNVINSDIQGKQVDLQIQLFLNKHSDSNDESNNK